MARSTSDTTTAATIDLCTQPHCLMQDEGVDSTFLAELIVRLMEGEDVSDLLGSRQIARRSVCVDCVRRVLRDRRPVPTLARWRRLVKAGRRSYRRRRRRERSRVASL